MRAVSVAVVFVHAKYWQAEKVVKSRHRRPYIVCWWRRQLLRSLAGWLYRIPWRWYYLILSHACRVRISARSLARARAACLAAALSCRRVWVAVVVVGRWRAEAKWHTGSEMKTAYIGGACCRRSALTTLMINTALTVVSEPGGTGSLSKLRTGICSHAILHGLVVCVSAQYICRWSSTFNRSHACAEPSKCYVPMANKHTGIVYFSYTSAFMYDGLNPGNPKQVRKWGRMKSCEPQHWDRLAVVSICYMNEQNRKWCMWKCWGYIPHHSTTGWKSYMRKGLIHPASALLCTHWRSANSDQFA